MDARIFFLVIAAVVIAGFVAVVALEFDGRNGPTRVASDRVILKIGEPAGREQLP